MSLYFFRWLLIVFFCYSFLVTSTDAEETATAPENPYSYWMTYYYLEKDSSKLEEFLNFLHKNQYLDNNTHAASPMTGFLTVIFYENPNKIPEWTKREFSGALKETVDFAVKMSASDYSDKKSKKFNNPTLIKKPPLLNLELKTASDLDMMWAAFSASGSDVYVQKIIDVLDDGKILTGNKAMDKLTRMSAKWSLSSNAMQHELVNRVIKKECIARSGKIKEKLKEILQKNSENLTPFPNKNGLFSAMIVVTDMDSLKEFDKPFDQGLQLDDLEQARRGQEVAINIVYGGMDLTEDLQADVSYDIKILDPDGTVYDEIYKNVEAFKSKVPTSFQVFHNKDLIIIKFESNDKLGKYKITVEIRDNISKKKIPLFKEIDLIGKKGN